MTAVKFFAGLDLVKKSSFLDGHYPKNGKRPKVQEIRFLTSGARVAIEYNPSKNYGFGLSVNNFRVKAEAEESDYPGIDFTDAFEYDSLGLMADFSLYLGE